MHSPSRFVLVASVVAAPLLAAQTPAAIVEPGAVIRTERVDPQSPRLIGTLVSRTADTLTLALRSGGIAKVPTATVRAIDVSTGKERLLPALKWAFIGSGIWGALTAVLPLPECDPARSSTRCANFRPIERGEFVATQMLGMAMITGTIGAIRGRESWARIEGPAAAGAFVRPTREGVAVGYRLGI